MNWQVEILRREGGKFLYSPGTCEPLYLDWNDRYGPNQARVFCPCGNMTLQDWAVHLGQDMRVYDPDGRLAWWGYLESVEQTRGGQVYRLGLDEVANRVAVRYLLPTDFEPFVYQQSEWQDDLLSQEAYGVKENLLQRQYMHSQVAELVAADWLAAHSLPNPIFTGSASHEGREGFRLLCRGWMQTLSWCYWQGWNGIVEHRPAQLGTQALGQSSANLRLAQAFTVPESVEAFSASVRARRQGAPADNLRISIQYDLSNQPSGLTLTSAILPSSGFNPETYQWVEGRLPGNSTLEAGQRYWLVLERTGSPDYENCYWLGLDENASFQDGRLLLQNASVWTSRTPNADLLFQVVGRKGHKHQINHLVALGGQFLNGVDTSLMQESMLPLFTGQGKTCLQTFFALLEQGNAGLQPLCSTVSPGRLMKIWQRPRQKEAQFFLENDGSISDGFGQPLQAFWHAVGQWLHTAQGKPVYISGLSYDFARRTFQVNNQQLVSYNRGENQFYSAEVPGERLL
ncbi:MAG: hypothetical protein GX797_01230 [Chloroflexi bacterium]|nr:hypothetical protein [Chloroflexota bacterium]